MSEHSLAKAQRLVERCNRQRELIENLQERLEKLREKHNETVSQAFSALPDGCAISLDPKGPWKVVKR